MDKLIGYKSNVVLAVGVLMFSSGCASISETKETTSTSIDSSETNLAPWVMGPLEQYIVRIVGHPQFDSGSERQAEINRAHLESEELIAACMRDQGFEYLINPSSGIQVFDRAEIEFSVPYGSRAWAEAYGFGITHPDLVLSLPPLDEPHHAAELLEEMTPSEVAAWFYALYGGDSDSSEGGCFAEARATLWWNTSPVTTGFEVFADEVWRYWAWIWSGDSPLFSELDTEWVVCMADSGLDLLDATNPIQLENHLFQENNQLENLIQNGWEAPPEAQSDRMNREIALAITNWDCNQEIDYIVRRREIELRLEQEFVDRHRGELEYWAILNQEAQAARRESTAHN